MPGAPAAAAVNGCGLHEQRHALDDAGSLLAHQLVVARQTGLALGGIDDDHLGLRAGRGRELDVGGEGGAAESDDAGILDETYDGLGVERGHLGLGALGRLVGHSGGICLAVGLVTLDEDGLDGHALRGACGVDLDYGARDGGVHGSRHKAAGLGHALAAGHLVALLDDGFGGGADMLCHGQHDLGGKREVLDSLACGDLVFGGMDAADFKSMQFHGVAVGRLDVFGGGRRGLGLAHGEVHGVDGVSGAYGLALAAQLALLEVDVR